MRRALRWCCERAAAVFLRAARLLYRTEAERSMARWVADGGERELRLRYDVASEDVVLDLGGYEGQWASDVFARFGCHVHVFEPVPAFARRIRERFERNPRIQVHAFGLAAEDGQVDLCAAGPSSSAFRSDGERVRVPMRSVRAFFDEHGVTDVALVKMNIEGGEYDLLEHLVESGLIRRIRDLKVQFHDCVPDAARRMGEIQDLRQTHEPAWQYRWIWESWHRRERDVDGERDAP